MSTVHCLVVRTDQVHPAFKTGEISRTADPYASYTAGATEAMAYVNAHPELARKAGAGLTHVAAQNPDLVRSVMTGATAPSRV